MQRCEECKEKGPFDIYPASMFFFDTIDNNKQSDKAKKDQIHDIKQLPNDILGP